MTIQELQAILVAEGPAPVRAVILRMGYDEAMIICRANGYVVRDNESPYTTLCRALEIDPYPIVPGPAQVPQPPTQRFPATIQDLRNILDIAGPMALEQRLNGMSADECRRFVTTNQIRAERGTTERDVLRMFFGLNTWESGDDLGRFATVITHTVPNLPPIPVPIDTTFRPGPAMVADEVLRRREATAPVVVPPPNMEPEVQPNITPIAPKRPWGATTTGLEIYSLLELHNELFSDTIKSRLIEVYRMMANETGPTALNTKIIKLMIGNARDSRLFQDVKMVRDQEICDLLDTLKEGSSVIRSRFPSARQLPPERFIFKKTPAGIQYWNLERHANIMVTVTSTDWSSQWGSDLFHSHSFLYKRDPSVPTRDILEAKARSYGKMDEYIANPGYLRGNGLSKIQRIIIDEFRGNLVAVTLEGDVILHDPVMIYHPKFGLAAKVKIVRDSKARRSIKYMNRSHLNSGMKIDRIMVNNAGLIHYDLRRVENFMALNVIREVPETLIEPAQRTKAFGSIAKSV
jgi:hypothetical protein